MKEYKLARGWAIIIWIFSPLLIIIFLLGLLTPLFPSTKEEVSPTLYFALILPLSLGMITLMTVGLLDTVKNKVIISGDSVIFRSTFIKRDLKFDEIRGFRVSDKYIFVEPNTKDKKRIKISTYLGKSDELILWLSSNFLDLDFVNKKKEHSEILENNRNGITEEERSVKLQKAKLVAKALNWMSIIACVWVLFFPTPYEIAIISTITLPLIAILATFIFKGLIRLEEGKGTAYPSVFMTIFFCSCGICLRAMFDFNIFEYRNVWKPSFILSVILIAVVLSSTREFKFQKVNDYIIVLSLSIFFFAFSYGTVIALNCYYDKSEKEIFEATILSKRISSGKTTSYYFELTPWGRQIEIDEVSVSKRLYQKLEKNDKVNLFYGGGLFNIPWFIVTE
jgi:hypothetical protein